MFQDAKTEGKHVVSFGGMASGYYYPEADEDNGAILPQLMVYGSYGLRDNLDIQAGLSASSLYLAPKFQILGNQTSKFALSLNPGIEFFLLDFIESFDPSDIEIWPSISLIGSIHLNDKLSFFVEPRYIFVPGQFNTSEIGGASVGMKYWVHPSVSFSLGSSYFKADAEDRIYQLGLGLNYRILKN